MASQLDPQPSAAPIAVKGLVSPEWFRWFYELYALVVASVQSVGNPVRLTGQGAAIGSTTIALPSLQNGQYRVSWYIRITTPDAVNSSVAVTIGFTESAQPLSKTFAAITGNTVTTFDQSDMFIEVDQNTALTYSTTYASNTPGAMKYRLTIAVESV